MRSTIPQQFYFAIPAETLRCPALVAGIWRDGQWVPAGRYAPLQHHLTRGERVMVCRVGDDPTSYESTFYCVRDFDLRRFQVEVN